MHVSLLNALDSHASAPRASRRDRTKAAQFEPFVIASLLEAPHSGRRRFADARHDEDAPAEEDVAAFDLPLAVAYSAAAVEDESAATMPEDALDGQDLCAMLQAAASR
jgi:hypothetical protein